MSFDSVQSLHRGACQVANFYGTVPCFWLLADTTWLLALQLELEGNQLLK